MPAVVGAGRGRGAAEGCGGRGRLCHAERGFPPPQRGAKACHEGPCGSIGDASRGGARARTLQGRRRALSRSAANHRPSPLPGTLPHGAGRAALSWAACTGSAGRAVHHLRAASRAVCTRRGIVDSRGRRRRAAGARLATGLLAMAAGAGHGCPRRHERPGSDFEMNQMTQSLSYIVVFTLLVFT